MDGIPFPKTREGVLSSLILSVVLLTLYYLLAFQYFLLPTYDKQFYEPLLYAEDEKSGCYKIQTYVRIPRYVYQNGRQWIYVSFRNVSDKEINDLRAHFILKVSSPEKEEDEGNEIKPYILDTDNRAENDMFLLPSFFSGNLLNDYVDIEVIQPGVELYGRFGFPTKTGFSIGNTRLMVSCVENSGDEAANLYSEKKPKSTIPANENGAEAFLHSTLENLLLPPWANGVVPAFAVLASFLFEKDPCKDIKSPKKSKKTAGSFVSVDIENKGQNSQQFTHIISFLSEMFRIILLGFLFNLLLWFVFIVSVQGAGLFIAVVSLLIVIPVVYKVFENSPNIKKKNKFHFAEVDHKNNRNKKASLGEKNISDVSSLNSNSPLERNSSSTDGKQVNAQPEDMKLILEEIQHNIPNGLLNTAQSLETLAKLESMNTIVGNVSLSDAESLLPPKKRASIEGRSVEYVCNNCGLYQGSIRPEKCKKCNSTDIVEKI